MEKVIEVYRKTLNTFYNLPKSDLRNIMCYKSRICGMELLLEEMDIDTQKITEEVKRQVYKEKRKKVK